MNKIYRSFFIRFAVVVAILAVAIFCLPFLAKVKAYRDWRIRQSGLLIDDIHMRIEGIYILPGNGYRLLRIWCRWVGGNPDEKYDLRASIRTTAEFKETSPMPYWYTPLEAKPKPGEDLFLWEFHAPPDSPYRIWLRVFFRKKNSNEEERWVDFNFPYFQAEDPTQPSGFINYKEILPLPK